jgi:peroxiredoxin
VLKKLVVIFGLLIAVSQLSTAVAEKKPPQWIPAAQRKKANLVADLKTLDGKSFSLAEHSGKILLVNYWATWCGPCKEELPSIATLYRKLHDQGLDVVAVSAEKPDTVQKYLKDKDFPFTTVVDPKDTIGRRFGLNIVPSTLVIDDSGKVALNYGSEYDWSSPMILEGIQSLLGQAGSK